MALVLLVNLLATGVAVKDWVLSALLQTVSSVGGHAHLHAGEITRGNAQVARDGDS
jgi:hypothetical protein